MAEKIDLIQIVRIGRGSVAEVPLRITKEDGVLEVVVRRSTIREELSEIEVAVYAAAIDAAVRSNGRLTKLEQVTKCVKYASDTFVRFPPDADIVRTIGVRVHKVGEPSFMIVNTPMEKAKSLE